MQAIVFESLGKPLLFLHLVAGVCGLAVAVHLVLRAWRGLRIPRAFAGSMRLHALILLISYACAFVLGAIIYPTYRIRIRADFFDKDLPWATGLFEIKEHLASVAFLPILAIYVMSRRLNFHDEADRRYAPLFFGLLLLVLAVFTYNAVAGWYLSSLRSL